MKNPRHLALAFSLGWFVLIAVPSAFGQQLPGRGRAQLPQARVNRPLAAPADVQAWFDAMVVVQAQKALGLTDAQYPQFVGRLKALQDTRRRNQQARNQMIQQMARLTNPATGTANDTELRAQVKALEQADAKAAAELRQAYEQLDQMLEPRQQARFRVFEAQIERRKFELLLNARQRPPRR